MGRFHLCNFCFSDNGPKIIESIKKKDFSDKYVEYRAYITNGKSPEITPENKEDVEKLILKRRGNKWQ